MHGNAFYRGLSRRLNVGGAVAALLAAASLAPVFAAGTVTFPHQNAVNNPPLPGYIGHFTALYSSPPGYTVNDALSITAEVDDVWNTGTAPRWLPTTNDPATISYDQSQGGYPLDVNPASLPVSYNTQAKIRVPYNLTGAVPGLITLAAAPYYIGLTLFKFHDASGAVVPNVQIVASDYTYGSDGSWDTKYPLVTSGRVVLGQGVLATGDQPYPDGLAVDHFFYQFTVSGYAPCHAYFASGLQSGGQTVDVTFSASSSSAAIAATTAADNPDVAPATPPTGGGGSLFNMDDFFKRLAAFFFDPATAKPALTTLKAASDQLAGWGPFSLPAQCTAVFAYASTLLSPTPSNDPDYWVFPSYGYQIPGGTYSLPADYNNSPTAPTGPVTYTPGIWDNLSWSSIQAHGNKLDLRPYASFILFGRYFVALMVWLKFIIEVRNQLTPAPKV